MKRYALYLVLLAVAILAFTYLNRAHANTACGFPPFPPYGMEYVCICSAQGQNCHWILVSKR